VEEAVEAGHVSVWLDGEKLHRGYALTRIRQGWLLVKMEDEAADARRRPTSTEPRSVLTGRTVRELTPLTEGEDGGG
jgi:hypothetical protein